MSEGQFLGNGLILFHNFSTGRQRASQGLLSCNRSREGKKRTTLGDLASLEAGLWQGNHHIGQKVCRARKMFKGSFASEMSKKKKWRGLGRGRMKAGLREAFLVVWPSYQNDLRFTLEVQMANESISCMRVVFLGCSHPALHGIISWSWRYTWRIIKNVLASGQQPSLHWWETLGEAKLRKTQSYSYGPTATFM